MKKSRLLGAVSACLFTHTALRTSINTTIARLVLLVAGCLVAATVNAVGISRVNLDGSGRTTLAFLATQPTYQWGIALDVGGGQMYWTDDGTGTVQRANLDGSVVTDLVTGLGSPGGIALDVGGGQMYWTNAGTGTVQRANLDGSGVTDLVTGLGYPLGSPLSIALDVGGGQMYWTTGGMNKIQRANLDGSGVADLVTGLSFSFGIALDVGGGQMYWTEPPVGKIQRANLDGSGVDLVTQLPGHLDPWDIALDLDAGHIYYKETVPLPASLWLFGTGLLGLIGIAKRKAA